MLDKRSQAWLSRGTRVTPSPVAFPPRSTQPAQLQLGCVSVFGRFKQLFDSGGTSIAHHNEMQTCLQLQNQSVKQLQEALLAQERQVEIFTKQQRIIEGLTRQLEMNSSALEALETKFKRQAREYQCTEEVITDTQQELGIKRGRIEELQTDTNSKQQKIEQLEQELRGYRGICSYVTAHTLVLTFLVQQPRPTLMSGSHVDFPVALHRSTLPCLTHKMHKTAVSVVPCCLHPVHLVMTLMQSQSAGVHSLPYSLQLLAYHQRADKVHQKDSRSHATCRILTSNLAPASAAAYSNPTASLLKKWRVPAPQRLLLAVMPQALLQQLLLTPHWLRVLLVYLPWLQQQTIQIVHRSA